MFCFFALAKKLGITDVPAEVVTFISHATQNRLRTVIEKVTVITQHRMESYKVSVPRNGFVFQSAAGPAVLSTAMFWFLLQSFP